jgi:hypothetical protein
LGIISAAGKSLWICRRNNSRCGPVQVRSGHSIWLSEVLSPGYPPSPIPLNALFSAAFAKQVWQNPEHKGFRYQNLDSKRLSSLAAPF